MKGGQRPRRLEGEGSGARGDRAAEQLGSCTPSWLWRGVSEKVGKEGRSAAAAGPGTGIRNADVWSPGCPGESFCGRARSNRGPRVSPSCAGVTPDGIHPCFVSLPPDLGKKFNLMVFCVASSLPLVLPLDLELSHFIHLYFLLNTKILFPCFIACEKIRIQKLRK